MEKGFFKSGRFLLLGKDDGGTGLQRDRLNFAPQRPKNSTAHASSFHGLEPRCSDPSQILDAHRFSSSKRQ